MDSVVNNVHSLTHLAKLFKANMVAAFFILGNAPPDKEIMIKNNNIM